MQHIEVDFPIEQITPLAQREANAKRPIYMLHKWWARRLGCVFRTIILASLIPDKEWRKLDDTAKKQGATAWHWLYYRQCHRGHNSADHTGHGCALELLDRYCKDKVILDPFMGGGTTIVEALRLGCKVIGVDVNPVAWFIVKKSVEPVDVEKLEAAFKKLEATVAPDILKWYRTRCPNGKRGNRETGRQGNGNGYLADVMYVFWVKAVRCSSCGEKTRLFNSLRIATKAFSEDGKKVTKDAIVCPECYHAQWVKACPEQSERKGSKQVTCSDCGHTFDPQEGFTSGGRFTCEHCKAEDTTVDWVRRTGKAPDYEMFAVEYWCQTCYDEARQQGYKHQQAQQKARGYKGADDFDRKLYRNAVREFEKIKDALPLPEGDVYEGMKTSELLNHGFLQWRDLFNPRQLLCLGRLMKAIGEIEDRAVKEMLVLTVSQSLAGNCLLTRYRTDGRLVPHFSLPAYWVPDEPCENNVWGRERGASTFVAYRDITMDSVKWLLNPTEYTTDDVVILHDSPMTGVKREATAVLNSEEHCALFARTSEDLSFLPNRSVDAVVTDPPYYGQRQYAELSEFFYVWLRLALKDEYPEFSMVQLSKAREIVVNEKARTDGGVKDDTFFRQGLLRCFRESCRVLKDDGLLAFTFHHEAPKAWAAVLDAVLQAGFDIRRVWTVHSETKARIGVEGINFDTVIVAEKRKAEPSEASWQRLQDEIASEVQDELKRLLQNDAGLGMEDVFVVTMGKALAVYSRHYPKVMREGRTVELDEAIEDIEGLVNEQIDAYWGLVVPAWLDVVSRIYLQTLAHRETVSRDQLVKMSTYAGTDYGALEEQQLMRRGKKAGVFEVLTPAQRKSYLENQRENDQPLTPIDRAHWLYSVYKEGRGLREAVPQVYEARLEQVLGALAKITRDRTYERLQQEVERLKGQRGLA